MRKNKNGTPDKRFKKKDKIEELLNDPKVESVTTTDSPIAYASMRPNDPNELLEQFLEENNIELEFDTMCGFVASPDGIKRLKNQLVIKATYVRG